MVTYFVIYFVDVLVCDQYLDNKTQKSNGKVCCHLSVTPACSHVCLEQVAHRPDSFGPVPSSILTAPSHGWDQLVLLTLCSYYY